MFKHVQDTINLLSLAKIREQQPAAEHHERIRLPRRFTQTQEMLKTVVEKSLESCQDKDDAA